jgi:hypothetical protein
MFSKVKKVMVTTKGALDPFLVIRRVGERYVLVYYNLPHWQRVRYRILWLHGYEKFKRPLKVPLTLFWPSRGLKNAMFLFITVYHIVKSSISVRMALWMEKIMLTPKGTLSWPLTLFWPSRGWRTLFVFIILSYHFLKIWVSLPMYWNAKKVTMTLKITLDPSLVLHRLENIDNFC